MKTMEARYRSKCPECDDMIDEGETIIVGDSGARHAECPEDRTYVHHRPPCPRCFLEPAANGSCGCDE